MIKHAHILLCSTAMALVLSFSANAQVSHTDSLKNLLSKEADTAKIKTMIDIGAAYDDRYKYDTALNYYLGALKLAEAAQNKEPLFRSLMRLANFYEFKDNFQVALEFGLRAQKTAEEENNRQHLFDVYNFVGGIIYFNHGNYDTSLVYSLKVMKIAGEMNDQKKMAYAQMCLGDVYRAQRKYDKAFEMYSKSLKLAKKNNYTDNLVNLFNDIALISDDQGKYGNAIPWFLQSIAEAEKDSIENPIIIDNAANAYFQVGKYDSALVFARKLITFSESNNSIELRLMSYRLMARIYAAKKMYSQAYNYLHTYEALKDSVNSTEEQNKIDLLESEYKTDKQKREIDLLQKNSELQGLLRNVLIGTATLLLVTAFLIANKYSHKKKAEAALGKKNNELNHTLTELKATQAQLIQAEKMASLGELTAGIAHEIQNPLNFVNNFSEVNTELIDELQTELKAGNTYEALGLSDNIKENEQKINHHGKRADAIVKGMLQHSRKSTGQKELTDINALADEYLRLSYHGLRAKDKTFNAGIITDFDSSIGKISIIPQDIGRVLLNLFNNAFYAVGERLKLEGEWYKAEVTVTTKRIGDKVEIRVADNGIGIPQKIIDKIFQPFFTTKPAGQGTGLGLSLSYDIVKANGGEIRVETKEARPDGPAGHGDGTTFIVYLPLNNAQ